MIWWLAYDISSPKRLRSVAKLCQREGLKRIQKSIYVGDISQEQVICLRENLLRWIDPVSDRVLMLPMSERSTRSAVSLGVDEGLSKVLEKKEIVYI